MITTIHRLLTSTRRCISTWRTFRQNLRFSKREVFGAIGLAILENLQKQGYRVLVIAVTPTHVHFLVELPDDVARIKAIVGWCKRFATRAARTISPELKEVEIWADGETYKAVDSEDHLSAARDYILTQQGADAWTWTPENGPSW